MFTLVIHLGDKPDRTLLKVRPVRSSWWEKHVWNHHCWEYSDMMIPILSVLNIDMIKISSLTNLSKWYLYYRPIPAENFHQLFADLSPDYSCDRMSSWRVINNKINMKFKLLNIPSANSCSQSVSSNLPFWLVMQNEHMQIQLFFTCDWPW